MRSFLRNLAVLICTLTAWTAAADVPRLFSLQGVLRDKQGALQSTMATVTIKLFAAETGGDAALWTVPVTGVQVSNGLFTVNVPVDDTLAAVFGMSPLWLEMTVNGDTFPRQQLTPDVYALVCGTAETLKPSTPTWVTLTLEGAWIPYNKSTDVGAYNQPQAYLDPFGFVHLRGMISAAVDHVTPNAGAANTVALHLPANMRPKSHWLVSGMSWEQQADKTMEQEATRIDITTDGAVTVNGSKKPVVWTSLDGITFSLN